MNTHDRYRAQHPVRVVTAASLFDGHDAAINIMRRILQASGCEVIHLGHNRTADDVVWAAIHEDAQAVAVSSYQGGHMEYFRYVRRLLDERGAGHVRIFGGGGGVIVPEEIAALQDEGSVDRIYAPEDGIRLGLQGMIDDLIRRADFDPAALAPATVDDVVRGDVGAVARMITRAEAALDHPDQLPASTREALAAAAAARPAPVLGITGTGGAGKSSLTDELLRRWLFDRPTDRVAVLSVDPTRKRTGGALLGDRIRMNAIDPARVYMRSLATRARKGELSGAIREAVSVCRAAGYDLVIVETSGIGQGDADITELATVSLYVMTPEYGAPSQLEKIDMLDYADLVAINKFGKRGARDALRDVRKQLRRNRELWSADDEALPVYGTVAARFNDAGVTALYRGILDVLAERLGPDGGFSADSRLTRPETRATDDAPPLVAADRQRYLADIADTVRAYHDRTDALIDAARRRQRLSETLDELSETDAAPVLADHLAAADAALDPGIKQQLDGWHATVDAYHQPELAYRVRGKEIRQPLTRRSLAGLDVPRVVVPDRTRDHGEIVRFLRKENVPGQFPFTGGVFPLKRTGEDPKRMFAGEGGPDKTNRRFHLLCEGETAHRLSTAFDSVTLYGEDPDARPDIYGKIGESGVSVPHLDDMKRLYADFDLCAPTTSVSMTINGPAPMLLAMFFNTAIDDHIARWAAANGGDPDEATRQRLTAEAVRTVRGTVQADILKEDQAQNTCIFSTEFALKMMGDIQAWFIENGVRNFYSVSISGYHIAEAGANPITQLAFTLANGFTIVEYYLARGMAIDDFAPNLSFFFSNGLDPEYTVLGRVARRIWAVAMRERYGASARSQQLKYHIQTSGRSLHAREIQFNDIRTTLQALLAITDNCNSLHTNAYDEAITTPTEESVRRAMAIQLIINREFGAAFNENNLQGSYFVEHLTDAVEAAVLAEFERLNSRGGVLGAMELQYQRSTIQEESMVYEHRKHDGSLPIVGINTFLDPSKGEDWMPETPELRRAAPEEKDAQIASVRAFQAAHADEVDAALARLQQVALAHGNLFGELMHTVRVATLGQITHALYEVGGAYRRNL
ncbi:MAG: cobalamin B12-binding domain-containing protein [Alphaproteobacteria bacterium]|nr:cobalamin B12-binding domain-containing protein [Alphaproteobacteria bacterium]